MPESVPEYVEIAASPGRYRLRLWSLVLLSVGIANMIVRNDHGGYSLLVPESQAERAARELGLFVEENRDWPPPKRFGEESLPARHPPTVLVMGSLLVFYIVTGGAANASRWFQLGEVDSRAILSHGEWWRLVTALTLHADIVHLMGNLVLGGLVIHFLLKVYGTGLGLFLTLLTGTLGNYLNVLSHGPGHFSIGFSTAVFSAVGLLSGSQMSRRRFGGVVIPLGAGLALLAMIGSGGEHTDLGAHLWGLLVGLAFGLPYGFFRHPAEPGSRREAWFQGIFLMLALLLVVSAWFFALSGHPG